MRARLLGLMTAVALISASGLGASNDLEWTESVSVGRSETYQAESNTPLDDLGTTLEIPLPDAARLAGYEIARVSTLVQLVNDFQGRALPR